MLSKIILSLVLLIFTQQDFYGMENSNANNNVTPENEEGKWESINNWMNQYCCKKSGNEIISTFPKLWLLWAILDNLTFQYGNSSKIWEHSEAYYGLSNGIGFFPSFLNFGWLKVGIGDAHINVINTFLCIPRIFISEMSRNNASFLYAFESFFAYHLVFGIHLLSFEIFKCVKIRLTSIIACIVYMLECIFKFKFLKEEKKSCSWYARTLGEIYMSNTYILLAPSIEINISEIINYFNGK